MSGLFLTCEVFFDPDDTTNSSLYLFRETLAIADVDTHIKRLMESGLWTPNSVACVRDEQRQTYADQLESIDVVDLGPGIKAGRFNHPAYPSNADRWHDWLDCLK
ncbi:hypothetical protein [Litorivivens sp.]